MKPKHIATRLEFAKERLDKPEEKGVYVFIDEKKFFLTPVDLVMYVLRKKGQRFQKKNINYTKPKSSAQSVNCLCWISKNGKGEIYCAENRALFDRFGTKISDAKYTGFDGKSFLDVLKNEMIPDIKKQLNTDDFKLYMDNATIHCKVNEATGRQFVDEFLETVNVERIIPPARSPDLNPIEHVHNLTQKVLHEKISRLKIKPKNKRQGFQKIKESWKQVDNETVKNIYYSFESKCEKVVKHNGHNNFDG